MELVFLGTGAGVPSKTRNVTCTVLNLMAERQTIWLFDCGEATQHQFNHCTLKLNQIEKIFITHLHGDHLFGLPGLLSTRSFKGGMSPVTVYGPKGIKAFLNCALTLSQTHIPYPLDIVEIKEGIIFDDGQFCVSTAKLKHRIDSYGFRIEEKNTTGHLNIEALIQVGVPIGPKLGELRRGKDIVLEDGRLVKSADFMSEPHKGKVIVIFGDTEPTATELVLANGADVIVHEATYELLMEASAREYGHSTSTDAATLAREAQAKQLIITHISSRYKDQDYKILLDECRAIFPNSHVAFDLSVFKV